jgi:hypothetical protein
MKETSKDAGRPHETWAVHRQDDNGNRFVIETGLSRERADELVLEYESHRHKQTYWVERESKER